MEEKGKLFQSMGHQLIAMSLASIIKVADIGMESSVDPEASGWKFDDKGQNTGVISTYLPTKY